MAYIKPAVRMKNGQRLQPVSFVKPPRPLTALYSYNPARYRLRAVSLDAAAAEHFPSRLRFPVYGPCLAPRGNRKLTELSVSSHREKMKKKCCSCEFFFLRASMC
jgi:hypothetical protein